MLYRLWLECGLFYKDGSRAIPNNLENKKKNGMDLCPLFDSEYHILSTYMGS